MHTRRLLILGAMAAACCLAAGSPNVREKPYRAAGDGKKDDTQAFQRALDAAAAAGGGIVGVPAGRYLIAGHLTVPAGVTLQGVGRAPQSWSEKIPGSALLAVEGAGNPAGTPFLTLQGPNATIEGITVFYPNQVKTESPVPYPWTVRGQGDNVSIVNVLLVNPYQAVDFGTYQAPRHYVRDCTASPCSRASGWTSATISGASRMSTSGLSGPWIKLLSNTPPRTAPPSSFSAPIGKWSRTFSAGDTAPVWSCRRPSTAA